ncbi:hypothetical protein O7602_09155 [Micromonospora sp. WMMD1128]|uniref:hypothetical protein n=1 Tax=Micromonospora sp. WMMD1128 TaxID=3015150 RepID=UPI00248B5934|nr:hypothetical protein [Micromonospora sp. WMMD1128]WBB75650.1 hypothetical protein O7602_09155 [Micromonospora sp. WMMD1128]
MSASTPALEVLADGPGAPLVIIDFIRISAGAGLGELLASAPADRPVYRADPVETLLRADRFRSATDLAEEYAAAVHRLPVRPARIVGYCSATPVAVRTAELTGVPLVLVEPTWPDRAAAAHDFRGFRATLREGEPAAVPLDADPARALSVMARTLDGDLDVFARANDLPDDERQDTREQLVDRYVAWLHVLLSASADPVPPRPADVVLASRDYTAEHPGVETLRLDLSAGEMPTAPVTRAALMALVDPTAALR